MIPMLLLMLMKIMVARAKSTLGHTIVACLLLEEGSASRMLNSLCWGRVVAKRYPPPLARGDVFPSSLLERVVACATTSLLEQPLRLQMQKSGANRIRTAQPPQPLHHFLLKQKQKKDRKQKLLVILPRPLTS